MLRPTQPYQLYSAVQTHPNPTNWPTFARFAIACAALAANAHNTQPWKFKISAMSEASPRSIQILPDWSRHLTVSDPTGRQLYLSLGAALENLLVAARANGYAPEVSPLHEEMKPRSLTISVRIDERAMAADKNATSLAVAIPLRRTCRHVFATTAVDSGELLRIANQYEYTNTSSPVPPLSSRAKPRDLVTVTPITTESAKRSIADLAAAATRDAFANPAFRRELSFWIRNNFTRRFDGMPGFTNGIPDIPSLLGPTLIRFVNIGKKQAADEHAWITSSPLLAVLSTKNDDPEHWIAAGQLLERLALAATAQGISYSIIESPIEISQYRPKLAAIITSYQLPITSPLPQVLMRFGSCQKPHHPTPRRPTNEVTWYEATTGLPSYPLPDSR